MEEGALGQPRRATDVVDRRRRIALRANHQHRCIEEAGAGSGWVGSARHFADVIPFGTIIPTSWYVCQGIFWSMRSAPSTKIFPKNEWHADSELCKSADTVAIEAASINSAYASASNLGVAMARWIKCAHQNC
jgi:hypothetical protein